MKKHIFPKTKTSKMLRTSFWIAIHRNAFFLPRHPYANPRGKLNVFRLLGTIFRSPFFAARPPSHSQRRATTLRSWSEAASGRGATSKKSRREIAPRKSKDVRFAAMMIMSIDWIWGGAMMGKLWLVKQNEGNFSHLTESERCESFPRFEKMFACVWSLYHMIS